MAGWRFSQAEEMTDRATRTTLRDCVTCLLESASFWQAQNGPTGYLDYVDNFIH
jgi:hypothetical protein